ncbi:MAG: IS1595 family transposase [Terracidiphilus sp.]
MKHPQTLTEAIRYYADPGNCVSVIKEMRWPDGEPVCPHCGERRHYWLAKQMRWKCASCRKQFTAKTGTVFEDSPIPLDKWLIGIWLVANCKNGISSYEIARHVGVTQKTGWFLLQRIRYALANGSLERFGGPESGPVEVDECFIGGKPQNMHMNKRLKMKQGMHANPKMAVMGMLDRESRKVRATVIPNAKREVLQREILNAIEKGSTVYTDGWAGYDNLAAQNYIHETVTHMQEYVRGQVHTQGIENFWSLLKRGLNGTYVAVEPFHLHRYVDEQAFRYNNRATKDNPLTDYDRFMLALSQISGKN